MSELIPPGFRQAVAGRAADAQLADAGDRGALQPVDGDSWLAGLPALVHTYLQRWGLVVDGASRHGECALVVPVRGRDADAKVSVLKLTWPHAEARDEHLALKAWDGRGAVRLLSADPRGGALLLERLDADACLRERPLLEACEVVGGLFRELDRPALPQLDTVAARALRWRGQLRRGAASVPRRQSEQALSLLDDLVGEAPVGGRRHTRLVHEDLHDLNVLAPLAGGAAGRGRWVAIDPKPVAAEWAYAVAPIVWNRPEEAARAGNLRVHARLRADVVADAAGLDGERVRAWTFVRLVLNAVWAAEHAPASDAFRARMIALAKAFAD